MLFLLILYIGNKASLAIRHKIHRSLEMCYCGVPLYWHGGVFPLSRIIYDRTLPRGKTEFQAQLQMVGDAVALVHKQGPDRCPSERKAHPYSVISIDHVIAFLCILIVFEFESII